MNAASALAALAGAGAFLSAAAACRGMRLPPHAKARAAAALGRLFASLPAIRALPAPGDLEARLVAAGEPAGLGLREWIALKVAVSLTAGVLATVTTAGAQPRVAIAAAVAALACGFAAPDVWLARATRRRTGAALLDLPDMLDLLRVTVEAGMPAGRAFGVVGAEFEGALAAEWRRLAAAVGVGSPLAEALAGLRARLPADEIAALSEAVARSQRHGVPLGPALALQTRRARERRRRRVREAAARAGPKVQVVVALVLVPAVLLVVLAVLLAELERSGLLLPV